MGIWPDFGSIGITPSVVCCWLFKYSFSSYYYNTLPCQPSSLPSTTPSCGGLGVEKRQKNETGAS